ncbi:MAG: sterol desaturase family protein [Pseudomonadales bacterium]
MDLDLDTGKLIVFIAGFGFFLALEHFASAHPQIQPKIYRLGIHGTIAGINTVLVRVLTFVPMLAWLVYVEQQGWGIARWLGLTGWLEFVISMIVLDAFDYFWHRANHRVSFLWRFHKAHHSDTEMDVTTALRFHPGELLLSALAKASWVLIWGPSAIAWFLFEAMVSLCAQGHHSNWDLPDAIEARLNPIIVTPRFHATHHLVLRQYGDANFSTIFSIWDKLFRTEAARLKGAEILACQFGLPDDRARSMSLINWLSEPMKQSNLQLSRALRTPKG